MSGIRVAAHLRELERASPAPSAEGDGQSGQSSSAEPQQLGNRSLPAVSFTDGGTTFVILFDPATHLPAAIRTRDDDNIAGDSNYDLVLDGWTAAGACAGRNVAVVSDQRHRSGARSTMRRSRRTRDSRRMRSPFPLR